MLDRLERELADTHMSAILTDAQAWVLDRRAGERSLNSYLDKVLLAPGFSYAERFIGTNGIGTALEEKRVSYVFGHEHFVDRLQTLSCAGAPIRDPISGNAARRRANAVIHTASNLNVELCRKTGEFFRTWGLPGSRFTPTLAPPPAVTSGAEGGEQR